MKLIQTTLRTLVVTLALYGASAMGASVSPSLAFTPTGGAPATGTTNRLEVGTRFSLSVPLRLTGLGYYDYGLDGFLSPHGVRLWDDVGGLIVTTSVTSTSSVGGGSILGGGFRFEAVDVILAPGTYRLSGTLDAQGFQDRVLFDNSSPGDPPATFSGITYLGRISGPDGSGEGVFPASIVRSPTATDWFGPNMLVEVVPEPTVSLLLGLGGPSLVLARRRGRAR